MKLKGFCSGSILNFLYGIESGNLFKINLFSLFSSQLIGKCSLSLPFYSFIDKIEKESSSSKSFCFLFFDFFFSRTRLLEAARVFPTKLSFSGIC